MTSSFAFSILDFLPDAIIWVTPVFINEQEIEDFEIGYANQSANITVGHPKGNLLGLRILQDGVPSTEGAEANFKKFLEVYQSGETSEYTFYAKYTQREIEAVRRVFEGGVLSTTRDRSAQREAERRELEKAQLLIGIVNNAPIGIELYESIRDDSGEIIDFRIKLCNDVVHHLTGVSKEERFNLSFRELLKGLDAEEVFNRYKNTVESDEPLSFEFLSPRTQKWLYFSVVKLGDGFLITLSDITETKNSQQELQKQSDYLSSILNASLNAVCTCEALRDEDGNILDLRYTQINEMYTLMVGKTEKEVIGRTMSELFPTAVSTGVFTTHCNVIESNIPARFDLRYKGEGLDGWYDISSVKVGDNGVVITFVDVMEQKTASHLMEEQKNLLDSILQNSSNGISVSEMIRDKTGEVIDARTILANDAAIKFTGLPKEVYLSQTAIEIEPNIINTPYFQMCIQTLQTGEPFLTQYLLEVTGRWLELSVSRMDEDHLIHIFTDVTPIKVAQLQLERTVQELKRSNIHLEDFAHAASHDMKEPLRKIRTFLDRLKTSLGERINDRETMFMERIETSAERMQILVEDLLEFSHVSERPQDMDHVDLNEKIQRILIDLELPIEEKGASIIVKPLPTVTGYKRQLQQLFYNLISNALKYSKPNEAPKIIIESSSVKGIELPINLSPDAKQQRYYLIQVSDNGIGFEQEYAEKIFDMFQRLHGKGEYSGTGVGLSIARKVVDNHNGYIWANSEVGKGSTFNILLPL